MKKINIVGNQGIYEALLSLCQTHFDKLALTAF